MITNRTMREFSRLVEEVEALAVQIGLDPKQVGLDCVVSHARQRIPQLEEEVRAALAKVYPPGAIVPHEYDGPPCPTPPTEDEPRISPTDPENGCGPGGWREP